MLSRGNYRGEQCTLEIQFRVHTEQQPILKEKKNKQTKNTKGTASFLLFS